MRPKVRQYFLRYRFKTKNVACRIALRKMFYVRAHPRKWGEIAKGIGKEYRKEFGGAGWGEVG